ncbi:MAG: hypothetical protein JO115_05415, partial [Pseudonocardiales bacterium]|nr:hypothetical protein [Pseudonocardiales bacterium]
YGPSGISQTLLGQWMGLRQPQVSRIETGTPIRHLDTLQHWVRVLRIPADLLWFRMPEAQEDLSVQSEAPPTATSVPSPFPWYRRDFAFSAATTVVASAALPGTVIAEEEAATVHAITTAHRRLDGTTPSCDLAPPVAAQLRMVGQMQARSPDPRSRQVMAAAVSEVAGLAGWLYWDMHELGSARRHYRIAIEQAQRASGDSMLTAYMLGSMASFVVMQDGAADEGIALIRHAAEVSEGERPATGDAWLASIEAVAHASASDDVQSWCALDRAEAAVGRAAAEDPPPWPWVFPFDAGKIATHRLACAVRLRRPDVAYAAAANLPVSLTAGHRKQGALTLLDLACAHVQDQEVEEGLRVATIAIDLAATMRSERVLSRARQFRRTIPATVAPGTLRDFDERLRIANA